MLIRTPNDSLAAYAANARNGDYTSVCITLGLPTIHSVQIPAYCLVREPNVRERTLSY